MIHKLDQYIDLYRVEKMMNPTAVIVAKQFQKRIVSAVDRIVELSHGERDFIKSDSDWKVVGEIIKFFANEWPNEWIEFKNAMGDIKQIKGEGMSRSRGIMHVGSIPPRLMKMIKIIFPAQQWDKKFTSKFVRRFPLFKVGEINYGNSR